MITKNKDIIIINIHLCFIIIFVAAPQESTSTERGTFTILHASLKS